MFSLLVTDAFGDICALLKLQTERHYSTFSPSVCRPHKQKKY